MTVTDALRQVRALIERGWTQGALARDRWGHPVSLDAPQACRFCLAGAINRKAADYPVSTAVRDALRAVLPGAHISLSGFNDSHNKAEVLALIDRAIESVTP